MTLSEEMKQHREELTRHFELEQETGGYPLFFHSWHDPFSGGFLGIQIYRHNKKQVRVNTENDRGGSYDDGPRRTDSEHIYNIKDCSFSIERQNAFVFRTPEKDFKVDIFDEDGEDDYLMWEPDAVEEGDERAERQFPFMIKGLEAAGIKQTPL